MLIPNVSLVPFQAVLTEQCPQLILKADLLMMFILSGNVSVHPVLIGLADTEIGVASLPLKIHNIAPLFLEPKIRDAFSSFTHSACVMVRAKRHNK